MCLVWPFCIGVACSVAYAFLFLLILVVGLEAMVGESQQVEKGAGGRKREDLHLGFCEGSARRDKDYRELSKSSRILELK